MVETMTSMRSLPLKGKELRKTNKPLMEKKRRARINTCLNQLKSLVLQAMNKDSSQYSKLEKADILEMTVNFLKAVPHQKARAASQEAATVMGKYNTGFTECASQVARYFDTCQGVDNEVRSRVLNHLSHRVAAVNGQQAPIHHQQPQQQQQPLQPVYVQIPNTTQSIPGVHNAQGYPIVPSAHPATLTPPSSGSPQGALIVMPGSVVVPTPVTIQPQHSHMWNQQQFVMPMSPPSSTTSSRGPSPVFTASTSPVPSHTSSPQVASKHSNFPTNVEVSSEQLWRPW